jgi:uncharacterized protein YbaP (TraB family)
MKRTFLFFVLIISWSSGYSQLLWKITGKNLKNPSYIFAISPFISANYTDSIPGIFRRFSDCEAVIGETILNKIDYETQLLKAALIPQPATLDNYISKEKKQLIRDELLRVLNLQYKEVSALKPAIIANIYKTETIRNTLLFNTETELSSLFQSLGGDKGKIVEGVKNIDDMIKEMVDTTDLQSQADQLVKLMENRKKFVTEIMQMNVLYKAGKIENYYQYALRSDFITPKPTESYLNKLEKENLNWLKKIEEVLKTKTAFVVIDIMQLSGEKGLLHLLKNKGYKLINEN